MRNIKNINDNWLFSKEAKSIPHVMPHDWEKVNLPHTWNGTDGQDGGNDYYRGTCYYVKQLSLADFGDEDEYYLQFDAVNSSAKVYFNGELIAQHDGGYSAFRAKLGNIQESNLLVVAADNSPNDYVYPQTADFTFYGGIYRSVKLIGVSKSHFDLDYFGAPGISVTPKVTGTGADVDAVAYVATDENASVRFEILDKDEVIASAEVSGDYHANMHIDAVHLWNGVKDPYLYTLRAILLVNGEEVDCVSCRFGCRSFKIDPNKGFILNGREYPLRGVSRHQDRPQIGNALLPQHHKEDIDLICEMGANTIHLPNARANTLSQMKELIYQNYNHPSIVVWGLSNEITMGGKSTPDMISNHKELNELAHSIDSTRLTTMATVTMCQPDDEINAISDVLSYNHYFGWYGGNVHMYGPWFDNFHKKFPNKAIGISEYGCEALNWHTSEPEQGDYTEEYQAYYHEELIKQISKRPYLWATHVWNMFDFAADARAEGGENGMNHKGLVTFDRKYKKDSFYAYKAWLSDEPLVHICGKRYVDRVEPVTKVTVYSNQPQVELFVNGESLGKQTKGEYPFFYFEVPNIGESKLIAKAGDCTDESVIKKVEAFNEAYRMKEEGAVINWFEINTPPGYYSVNDTIGDIISTFKGKIFALKLVKILKKSLSASSGDKNGMSVAGVKINKTMIEMAKGFTLKRALMMLGGKVSKEDILKINDMLNKIKKKK